MLGLFKNSRLGTLTQHRFDFFFRNARLLGILDSH